MAVTHYIFQNILYHFKQRCVNARSLIHSMRKYCIVLYFVQVIKKLFLDSLLYLQYTYQCIYWPLTKVLFAATCHWLLNVFSFHPLYSCLKHLGMYSVTYLPISSLDNYCCALSLKLLKLGVTLPYLA